jgi:hypothetical protein
MSIKDISDVVKNIATVIAIFVGGYWTWRTFVRTRGRFPRANLTHSITHIPLTEDKVLLHVTVTISNTGELLLSFVYGKIFIKQVLPLWHKIRESIDENNDPIPEGERQITWPSPRTAKSRRLRWPVGAFQIEPGDSHDIVCDFILNSDVQVVKIYSHFTNIRKRKIGWDLTTLYDLRAQQQDLSKESTND